MNRRQVLAAVAAAPVFLGNYRARADAHLKWAVFTPDNEITYRQVMTPYAQAVQKETGNEVVFDMFPNGALGRSPTQQAQMVLDGVADIAWVIPGYVAGRFPDTEVLELPGLFRDIREATLVTTRLIDQNLLKDYGDYFLIGLFCTAPYSIHTNFPIRSLADLKGKTIRASGATESAALRALGAVPIGLGVTEIAEAISRRTISGTTSHMAPFFDFGLDRVTNCDFFVGLGSVPVAILMNRKKYEALPESVRASIRSNAGEAIAKRWTESIGGFNAEMLAKLKSDPKRTVVIPDDAQRAEIQKAFGPVQEAWINRSPRNAELKKILDAELARTRAA